MTDEINIAPGEVKQSGSTISTEATEARTALKAMFDSAQPAADGNKGFASGPALVTYSNGLKTEMEGTITDLETTGQKIVAAAETLQGMDVDNATGISRVATALNGLGKPPQ
ncbi:type VII secretion target [Nocardia sp. NPDC051756]|uniref:type VII secretion target n=1 Tax=Nocardia sp. NPDC051756 TaxID=3154751 RepID=UPI00341418AB